MYGFSKEQNSSKIAGREEEGGGGGGSESELGKFKEEMKKEL